MIGGEGGTLLTSHDVRAERPRKASSKPDFNPEGMVACSESFWVFLKVPVS